MDKIQAAQDIIEKALPNVPFDGWTQATLASAAKEAGYKSTDTIRVFPQGAIGAVDTYCAMGDTSLEHTLSQYMLDDMKIREKITKAVQLRIEYHTPHKEAFRKAVAMQALPLYAAHGLKHLYNTVDTIWYAIGDTSTDFNFYTKRLTLAGVYSSTVLYWLDDQSQNNEATWAFLDRRIANVMQIEKLKYQFKQMVS